MSGDNDSAAQYSKTLQFYIYISRIRLQGEIHMLSYTVYAELQSNDLAIYQSVCFPLKPDPGGHAASTGV